MAEPKLEDYMLPVLKIFEDQREHKHSGVMEELAEKCDLLQRDRPKRSLLMVNTSIGYLLKAGLIEKAAETTFRISGQGLQVLMTQPSHISIKDLRGRSRDFDEFIKRRYKRAAIVETAPPVEFQMSRPAALSKFSRALTWTLMCTWT